MKQISKDVKSKGEVVDTVKVPVYENIKEAIDKKGEAFCLEAINKTVSDAITNAARAAKVRPVSAQARLARLAKSDPKLQAEIDALLKKHEAALAGK